eukprot:g66245.t1
MPSRASLLSLPGGRDARQVLPHSRQPGYSRLRTPETQPRVGSLHGLGDRTPSAGSYGPSEYPSAPHYASLATRLSLVLECVLSRGPKTDRLLGTAGLLREASISCG